MSTEYISRDESHYYNHEFATPSKYHKEDIKLNTITTNRDANKKDELNRSQTLGQVSVPQAIADMAYN